MIFNKYSIHITRLILGAILLAFGINKFLHFMSMPNLPTEAQAFMKALDETEYMIPMIAITEITTGILLLANRFVSLSLLLLAPLSVNIILFHLVLAPIQIVPAAVVAAANAYLFFGYRPKYEDILDPIPNIRAEAKI